MKLNRRVAGAVMGVGLLVGSIGSIGVLAQKATPSAPPAGVQVAPQQETGANDQVQEPSYTCSLTADQQPTISAADAEAAALAANSGATVVQTELDDENGCLVYGVELSNGSDVKVDAGNGAILHTEQDNEPGEVGEANEANEASEAEGTDHDNVQEEHESQADDASEAPSVEDAAGQ